MSIHGISGDEIGRVAKINGRLMALRARAYRIGGLAAMDALPT